MYLIVDMGSKESAGEEVGHGRNEDVEMDVWVLQLASVDKIKNERIRGTTKV